MGWDVTLRAALSLLVVFGLIFVAGMVAKRVAAHGGLMIKRPGKRRLSVVETLMLDGRRRLVLVRKDGTEHLLLLGGSGDLVVEPGVPKEPFALQTPDSGDQV
jgi:flagellar protein FliO/FliZ